MIAAELKRMLTSPQSEFVEQFLSEGSPRHHWLSGPAGSGLSQCAVGIIGMLKSAEQDARVLVLTPRMLVLQWFRRLEAVVDPGAVIEGNRRNLRELSTDSEPLGSTWPAGHIVLMDTWFAERFPDLETSVVGTPWQLVVWDGFHLPTFGSPAPRLALLDKLGQTPGIARILLLSQNLRTSENDLGPTWLQRTVWDRRVLEREDNAAYRFDLRQDSIIYWRSAGEKELLNAVQQFVERWRLGSVAMSPVDRLLAAVESSPFALQESLQRLSPSKASMVLRQYARLDAAEEQDEPEEGPDDPTGQASPSTRRASEAAELLSMIDGLSVDSKLDALLDYLSAHTDASHTLIECRFSATARYLRSALSELSWRVHLATAEIPNRELLTVLSAFERAGGLLVTTSAVLLGIELQAIQS